MNISTINRLKNADPGGYKILRKIFRDGTDRNGNISDAAREAARKAYRKLGYKK